MIKDNNKSMNTETNGENSVERITLENLSTDINKGKEGRKFKYSPMELKQLCNQYFTYVDKNPFKKTKYTAKNGTEIEYIKRPYTIESLCNYLNVETKTFRNWENNKDLLPIVTRARQIIRSNKMEGATAGIYNGNIVALDLGLKAKEDATNANIILNLNAREIKAIAASLSDDYGELPESTLKTIDVDPIPNDNQD